MAPGTDALARTAPGCPCRVPGVDRAAFSCGDQPLPSPSPGFCAAGGGAQPKSGVVVGRPIGGRSPYGADVPVPGAPSVGSWPGWCGPSDVMRAPPPSHLGPRGTGPMIGGCRQCGNSCRGSSPHRDRSLPVAPGENLSSPGVADRCRAVSIRPCCPAAGRVTAVHNRTGRCAATECRSHSCPNEDDPPSGGSSEKEMRAVDGSAVVTLSNREDLIAYGRRVRRAQRALDRAGATVGGTAVAVAVEHVHCLTLSIRLSVGVMPPLNQTGSPNLHRF